MNKTKMETPDSIQISGDGISTKDLRIKPSGKITMSKTLEHTQLIYLQKGIRLVPIEKIPVRDRLAWVQNQNRVNAAVEPVHADLDATLQAHARRDEQGRTIHPLDKDGNPILSSFSLIDPVEHARARKEILSGTKTVHLRLLSSELFEHLSSETPHPTQEGATIPAVSSEVLAAILPLFDVEADVP